MAEIRFYLDENIPVEIGRQLELSGIDVVSAHSLSKLGVTDLDHLSCATGAGRVLCTHDQDFLRLAATGSRHAGIVFGAQRSATIGGWVKSLRALHAQHSAEDMVDKVVFVAL